MRIPEVRLEPASVSEEARSAFGFQYAPEEIGTPHKLGGEPDWLQEPEVPLCSCLLPMSFYGQLDSIGDSISLADCGLIYVFVCFDCFETESVLQSG